MQRAVLADRFYGSDFHVAVDEAIRWSTQIPQRFPLFPFKIDDLPGLTTQADKSGAILQPGAVEKSLGARERATLLTVIAALAKAAGIDVSKPSKAGETIEALTMDVGARVSVRTIENHLNGIPDALERRSRLEKSQLPPDDPQLRS